MKNQTPCENGNPLALYLLDKIRDDRLPSKTDDFTTTYATRYQAQIFIGLKNRLTGKTATYKTLHKYITRACKQLPLCVSVTPTIYIYPTGQEQGAIIGIINYPRFPESNSELSKKVDILALQLLFDLKQCRISYITPAGVVMLSNSDQIKKLNT